MVEKASLKLIRTTVNYCLHPKKLQVRHMSMAVISIHFNRNEQHSCGNVEMDFKREFISCLEF